MRMTTQGAVTTISLGDEGTGRVCGGCTLCCKLIPVPEIGKLDGERCKHARHGKGCTIYAARPFSCRTWSCRWLIEPDAAGLHRPDRSHYVIDMAEDAVRALEHATGRERAIPVLQIWVDPAYPDAHRDPRLRAYLLEKAKQGIAALVRYDSGSGFALFAPPFNADGKWREQESTTTSEHEHRSALAKLRRG